MDGQKGKVCGQVGHPRLRDTCLAERETFRHTHSQNVENASNLTRKEHGLDTVDHQTTPSQCAEKAPPWRCAGTAA